MGRQTRDTVYRTERTERNNKRRNERSNRGCQRQHRRIKISQPENNVLFCELSKVVKCLNRFQPKIHVLFLLQILSQTEKNPKLQRKGNLKFDEIPDLRIKESNDTRASWEGKKKLYLEVKWGLQPKKCVIVPGQSTMWERGGAGHRMEAYP